jgi:hypothetical protein
LNQLRQRLPPDKNKFLMRGRQKAADFFIWNWIEDEASDETRLVAHETEGRGGKEEQ